MGFAALRGWHQERPSHTRLVGFAFLGPDGRFVPTAKHRSVNRLRGFYFVPPVLPEKLDLYVYVAAPGAVKSVPFRLENIPLP